MSESSLTGVMRQMFICDNIKIDRIVSSYLHRSSFVFDQKEPDNRLPINKRYLSRSSPQGSVLSPKFWRIFDKLFSKHYLDLIDKIESNCPIIDKTAHFAYADDHLTWVLFKFSKNTPASIIAKTIETTAALFRKCLDTSTKILGCGINPDKSELIVPKSLCTDNARVNGGKDNFVWLGYSLKLNYRYGVYFLDFSDDKIDSKIKSCKRMLSTVFQYTNNITIRYKVYKTYISPIIECFIAADIASSDLTRSKLEKFHHFAICKVLNVPLTSPIIEAREALNEQAYLTRKCIIANRLFNYITDENDHYSILRTLKNGKDIYGYKGKPIGKGDYIDKLFSLKKTWEKLEDSDLENLPFDPTKAKEAAKGIRKDVAKAIVKRKREENKHN